MPDQSKIIAETILQQLGGKRFIMMTGAKQFMRSAEGHLTFKIGRNAKGINYVRVKLSPMDDYTMEFIKARADDIRTVATREGVFCDQLEEVFTDETGLYTRL